MSRSNYSDSLDSWPLIRWRGAVSSAMYGARGQAFLRELTSAMDAMPVKELIAGELIDSVGHCCTIGVVCKARGLATREVDIFEPTEVGSLVGIAGAMAAEIEYQNDEGAWRVETPSRRWVRMRAWVGRNIR